VLVRLVGLARSGWRGFLARPAWQQFLALFLAAFALRAALVVLRPYPLQRDEVVRTALSFAQNGYLGNPFAVPTGVSAHVAPAYATILGLFFRWAPSEEAAIFCARILACLVVSLQIGALPNVARRLGLRREHGVVASLLWLPPIFPWLETSGNWEAPFISAAMMLCLALTIPVSLGDDATPTRGLLHGVAWGLSMLVAPTLLQPFVAVLALSVLLAGGRRSDVARYAVSAVVAAALVLAPWAVRNGREFGGFVFVRGNLGLELAVSNNDRARINLEDNQMRGGGMESHPMADPAQAERLRRIGEREYNKERMSEALAWIRDHPSAFASLTISRALRFWAPASRRTYQTLLCGFVAVGALLGLARLFRGDRRQALLLLGALLSYAAIYALVQSDIRYVYPVLWLELLLTVSLVLGLGRSLPQFNSEVGA
jgi:hypothetical protein